MGCAAGWAFGFHCFQIWGSMRPSPRREEVSHCAQAPSSVIIRIEQGFLWCEEGRRTCMSEFLYRWAGLRSEWALQPSRALVREVGGELLTILVPTLVPSMPVTGDLLGRQVFLGPQLGDWGHAGALDYLAEVRRRLEKIESRFGLGQSGASLPA